MKLGIGSIVVLQCGTKGKIVHHQVMNFDGKFEWYYVVSGIDSNTYYIK